MTVNILFICSQNQWRSPTGETIWRKVPGVAARSAGTSRTARHKVSVRDLRWADVIFVMEEKHSSRLRAEFRQELRYKEMHVLDIPDEYRYMDPELIDLLHSATAPIVERLVEAKTF